MTPPMGPGGREGLKIERQLVGAAKEIRILSLAGAVDSGTAPQLALALTEMEQAEVIPRIVVDLTLTHHVSTAGWGVIIMHGRRIRDRGGEVRISGLPPGVQLGFKRLGLESRIPSFADLQAALSTGW